LRGKDWMLKISKMVEQASQGYQLGDPALLALQKKQKKQKKLINQDQEHRKIRTERRIVTAEAYKW